MFRRSLCSITAHVWIIHVYALALYRMCVCPFECGECTCVRVEKNEGKGRFSRNQENYSQHEDPRWDGHDLSVGEGKARLSEQERKGQDRAGLAGTWRNFLGIKSHSHSRVRCWVGDKLRMSEPSTTSPSVFTEIRLYSIPVGEICRRVWTIYNDVWVNTMFPKSWAIGVVPYELKRGTENSVFNIAR